MQHPVDQDDVLLLEDLVDDPVVATPGRPKTFEFSQERLAEPPRMSAIGPRIDSMAAARTFSGKRCRCRSPSGVISTEALLEGFDCRNFAAVASRFSTR